MLVGCATAASLFPFVGTIVYMIVRPPEYLEDVRERELEMQAAEARLHAARTTTCARTATTRSRATSCAARAACASSRTRARTAPSRWTRRGRSARTARPRSRASRRAPRRRRRAAGARARRRRAELEPDAPDVASPRPRLTAPEPEGDLPMDRTLILVKPDAFARGLTGEIIARFERKGLRIVALKHMTLDARPPRRHYAEHDEQPVLRRARRLHHLRAAGRDGARGPRGRQGRAPGDRRDEPARGRDRLDPRRLRARGRPEHGPRLGLATSPPRARPRSSSPSLG